MISFLKQMYQHILTTKQVEMLPMLKAFPDQFYLVGETALALQLGHRKSIDFDLFSFGRVLTSSINRKIGKFYSNYQKLYEDEQEYTTVINEVKTTFYDFPFKVTATENFGNLISMPNILTLTAMKAFALGRRAKWKDYVDIYFALKTYSLDTVSNCAKTVFKGKFNERLFRSQIAYFDDIDYREQVKFMPGFEIPVDEIKATLERISTRM